MRKIFKITTLLLLTSLAMIACEEEDNKPDNKPVTMDYNYETIDNTSWQGVYNTYINSPYGGSYPMIMDWTIDFNGDNRGLVYLHIESPAIQAIDEEMAITNYVYNGNNTGTFSYNTYRLTFTLDGLNRTMEVDSLRLGLELDDTGNKTYFGGHTKLTQTR
ncbi:MAG: hypothetical protein IJM88_04360 [Bacteroidales bacterium]|nr:hypothetical protein [Bacteroidales bacterium]